MVAVSMTFYSSPDRTRVKGAGVAWRAVRRGRRGRGSAGRRAAFCALSERRLADQGGDGRLLCESGGAAGTLGLEGKVSGHSGRIGGATDHFAEETPPAVLQICGRWDSDLWQVYTRQCIDQTLKYTVRASKCADTAVEEIFDDYTQPAVVAAGV